MRLKMKPTKEHGDELLAFQPLFQTQVWAKAQIQLNVSWLLSAELGIGCWVFQPHLDTSGSLEHDYFH